MEYPTFFPYPSTPSPLQYGRPFETLWAVADRSHMKSIKDEKKFEENSATKSCRLFVGDISQWPVRVCMFACCRCKIISKTWFKEFYRNYCFQPPLFTLWSLAIHKDCSRLRNFFTTTQDLCYKQVDHVPRVNSCPGGFCCCVKLDSSYQVAKIAEIF